MYLDPPPLAVGVLIAAYWGRVLRMARKARRKTGRAANLVPRERLGQLLRLVWAPAVLVWVIHPFVTALVARPPSLLRPLLPVSPLLRWPAVAVAAACFAATLVCWKRMGRSWRMGIDPTEKTPLIATGPYAYVRHPIYALSQLLMLATMVVVPTPLMLAAGIIHILLLQWEGRREERHLLGVHGPAYAAYCARVGRFLPFPRGPRRGAVVSQGAED